VILHRCFAWNRGARHDAVDGPLWFPQVYQGEGRHDNPDEYGCLYLADRAVSCVVEQLAAFRGQRLSSALLRRRGIQFGNGAHGSRYAGSGYQPRDAGCCTSDLRLQSSSH